MNIDAQRNRWLRRASTLLKPILRNTGHPIPSQPLIIRVGTPEDPEFLGQFFLATPIFPSHIVISREISDAYPALRVLLHELCHFATETEQHAHGYKFRTVARAAGLVRGRNEVAFWTSVTPSLHQTLDKMITILGSYPC